MPPKKVKKEKTCLCGGNCRENHSYLPGMLLAALGILALLVNFGLLEGLEWLRAYPLLFVLTGVMLVVRIQICKNYS